MEDKAEEGHNSWVRVSTSSVAVETGHTSNLFENAATDDTLLALSS